MPALCVYATSCTGAQGPPTPYPLYVYVLLHRSGFSNVITNSYSLVYLYNRTHFLEILVSIITLCYNRSLFVTTTKEGLDKYENICITTGVGGLVIL